MKSAAADCQAGAAIVAPFTGAWIEIQLLADLKESKDVAPFTGAWIEIICEPTLTG